MTQAINILMAQINPNVGAIEKNAQKIIQIIEKYQHSHDLIIFPELALCGYPPEDLLLRPEFLARIHMAVQKICAASQNCHVVLGHPHQIDQSCFNAATVFYQSQTVVQYFKQQLPNYGVFDEERYFVSGPAQPCIFTINKLSIGLCICEDLWRGGAIDQLLQASIDMLVIINASPFDYTKPVLREERILQKAKRLVPVIYVNMVGGQDELVFDGQSLVMDVQGQIAARAPAFKESCHTVRIDNQKITSHISPVLDKIPLIYQALILGLQDYVNKNNIPGVLLGLSGGIDSALTLAIAADALGSERVKAFLLPSRYSASMSTEDAIKQATALNIAHQTLSIEPGFAAILQSLSEILPQQDLGITAENIQARIRAILLMAMSNHSGWMLISTSNKSEVAVGYTTLYGDMCGGFAVLKDVLKTLVYELAYYRNTLSNIIPERVLTRAPSAELAPNQKDQDRLPDYNILDAIISGYMEQNLSQEQLLALGYPKDAVIKSIQMIRNNEYKRRQSPPGTKISPRAFGRDWRYPLTQVR
ncbi:MAG: NAD+ synthase [Gammaproteobacteria bacterium]